MKLNRWLQLVSVICMRKINSVEFSFTVKPFEALIKMLIRKTRNCFDNNQITILPRIAFACKLKISNPFSVIWLRLENVLGKLFLFSM